MTAVLVVGAIAVIGAVVARVTWRQVADERQSVRHHQQTLETLRHVSDRSEALHVSTVRTGTAQGRPTTARPARAAPRPKDTGARAAAGARGSDVPISDAAALSDPPPATDGAPSAFARAWERYGPHRSPDASGARTVRWRLMVIVTIVLVAGVTTAVVVASGSGPSPATSAADHVDARRYTSARLSSRGRSNRRAPRPRRRHMRRRRLRTR